MRKGIKILGKVFSAAVLLLIILPRGALAAARHSRRAELRGAQGRAHGVSRKLETTVVDRPRGHRHLLARSRSRASMSRITSATRCSTSGSSTPSSRASASSAAGFALSRGEIADAKLYLRQTPGGEMNIKQIVNRISDPDKPKKGNFRLSLQQGLDREHGPLPRTARPSATRSYGIDFSHMHLYGITARVDDFTIDGQAIYTTIAALSARERSGFVLDHLAGRFYMTQGCLGFEDASIVTRAFERPDFPYISLAGDSWARVQGFHRRGAHRRRAAQYDRFDRRHRLFRPEAARLACGFQRRKRRGRGRGGRFHGPRSGACRSARVRRSWPTPR